MLKEGDKAPAFNLESDAGERIALKDLKGKKVILYFYPKDLTSGCTQQACDFRDSFTAFKRKNAVVLGVSKDPVAMHQKFKEKHTLPFPLLADVEGKVCEAYGVWKQKSMYGRKYMGIERTTFVIDEAGKIEKIYPKVKVKDHIKEVLAGI
ncbi:MAG: thioredoxin-dependent thiol peroxidase [Bdellovibrionota bacterium]